MVDPNERALMQALAQIGPVTVAIDSKPKSFQLYKSGIWDGSAADSTDKACDANTPDHAVVVVGYGTSNGVPFWWVRNSWGKQTINDMTNVKLNPTQ
jgi:cathepsin L